MKIILRGQNFNMSILHHDLWQMLSHLEDLRWDRKRFQIDNHNQTCFKNRDPFAVFEQLMASIYLILLKLPWKKMPLHRKEGQPVLT